MSVEDLEKSVKALQEQVEALTKRVSSLEAHSGTRRRGSQDSTKPAANGARPASRPATTGRANSIGRMTKPVLPSSAKGKEEKEEIDNSRVGSYMVGKRKVYYVIPSYHNADEKAESQGPAADLKLDYIYGYNGKNTRNNLFFLDESGNKLLYNIAATSVIFDVAQNSQQFFIGHDEDILSLCKHPSKPIAASGQLDPKGSGKPYIVIWNYEEMKQLYKIENFHDRGIISLQFTPDGKYLFSIGNDDSHTVAVWDWETNRKQPVAESSVSKDEVFGLTFNNFNKDQLEFATYGSKHFKLWTMKPKEDAKAQDKHKFVLNGVLVSSYKKTKEIQKAHTAACYLPSGECVAGSLSGDLFIFKDKDYDRSVKAHTGTVGAIICTDSGIASAGADGKILLFSNDLAPAGELKFAADDKKSVPHAMDFVKGKLVVGTVKNEIFVVDASSGDSKCVMEGHNDEFWGLAVHPTDPIVVTASNDSTIRAWSAATKSHIPGKFRKFEKDEVHSVVFSPDGKLLAAGFKSGRVAILDYDTFEVQSEKKYRKEQIDSIAFSPNGKYLAFGSWDQIAEVINVESHATVSTLKGHTSSITHLTWSADSKYLMTNSRDYEILFWDVETGKRAERNAMADVHWHDWSNILGWPVKGIFKKGMDGTDINAANISGSDDDSKDNKERFVATGDDSGKVTLYRYPVVAKEPVGKEFGGHSSHVTNVRFSKDNKYLYSAGGLDTGLFQWSLQ